MPYEPFVHRFPEIARNETRVLTVLPGNPDLPAGEYAMVELFCADRGCDCRRVFIDVFNDGAKKSEAVLAWGWEDEKFYRRWLGHNDPKMVRELKGPGLNSLSRQGPLAKFFMEYFKSLIRDEDYAARIKRHYAMFRETVDLREAGKRCLPGTPAGGGGRSRSPRGHDPCPCGSGRKFRDCCRARARPQPGQGNG